VPLRLKSFTVREWMRAVVNPDSARVFDAGGLLSWLSQMVEQRSINRMLIGVDGPDAAGKTTFAEALASRLPGEVVRASIDGFHRPRKDRYRRGPLSAEGYYRDSFDYKALSCRLLDPFRAGESQVVTRTFDFRTDEAPAIEPVLVAHRSVLVFDGVFLLRPGLAWDLAVYLHVAPDVTLARARVRDLDLFGSQFEIDRRYTERYLPGQALYRDEVDPLSVADVLVDNTSPEAPRLLRGPQT
jgi:uridine kinase